MTMHQKKRFYGSSDPNLVPEIGDTMDEFISKGGIMGMHTGPGSNLVYDKELGFQPKSSVSGVDLIKGIE